MSVDFLSQLAVGCREIRHLIQLSDQATSTWALTSDLARPFIAVKGRCISQQCALPGATLLVEPCSSSHCNSSWPVSTALPELTPFKTLLDGSAQDIVN